MRTVGGNLALDFLNTRTEPPGQSPEVLRDYEDLVKWGRHVGTLTAPEAARLLRRARRYPEVAREAYDRGLRLRGYLDDLFRALISDRRPPRWSIRALR